MCMYKKKIVLLGFGTIQGFRLPLEDLEHISPRRREDYYIIHTHIA